MNENKNSEEEVIIDVLGDLCLAWYILEKKEFLKVTEEINNCLGKVDFRIANLEAPFLRDKSPIPILKESPDSNLKTDKKYIDFIKNLEVDAYTLANNHLGDFGEDGIKDTIFFLEKLNKKYTGSSLNYQDIYKPLRMKIKNLKFSFFSVCENEFGIAKNNKIGVAGFQSATIKNVISQESKGADFKIVIFHGGTEHYPFPTPNQKQRYRWLIDIGANVVIGMHQHCPVGYEFYHNSLIIYGVGNFFFPRKNIILYRNWNVGYVVRLLIKSDKSINFQPIPVGFDIWGKKFYKINFKSFINYYTAISKPICDDNKLEELYKGWVLYSGRKHYEILKYCISNNGNDYLNNIVKNLLSCEAHNELLTSYLNLQYYEKKANYEKEFKMIQKYINVSWLDDEINSKKNNLKKRCILWGVSEKAERIYKQLKDQNYKIMVVDKDFNKQGFYFFNSRISSPDDVISKNKDATYYICTSKVHIEKIKLYLLLEGVPEQKILIG